MMLKATFLLFSLFGVLSATEYFYYNGGKKIALEKITSDSNSNLREVSNTTYYTTPNNGVVGVSDTIFLKVKDTNTLQSLAQKYNFTVTKELFANTYLIQVANNEATIPTANLLHLEEGVEYASPNFIKTINKR
jgi:sulfur transfer complex TusBCD TusB component (DsrH family)